MLMNKMQGNSGRGGQWIGTVTGCRRCNVRLPHLDQGFSHLNKIYTPFKAKILIAEP